MKNPKIPFEFEGPLRPIKYIVDVDVITLRSQIKIWNW